MKAADRQAPPNSSVDWKSVHARLDRAAAALQDADHGHDAAKQEAILRQRAKDAARPILEPQQPAQAYGVVVFELASQTFAIESRAVREAMSSREVTPLPGLPITVRGLANVRSRVVPVFDLRPLLELPPDGEADAANLLLLSAGPTRDDATAANRETGEFAVVIDRVVGARDMTAVSARRQATGLNSELVQSLTEDGLILLDVAALARALAVQDHPAR